MPKTDPPEIEFDGHDIRVRLSNGHTLRVSPSECLALAESCSDFLKQNHALFTDSATNSRTVCIRGKSLQCVISRHLDFWRRCHGGYWEPETFRVFDELVDSTRVYLDIGAWIGPTALYATQISKRSYALEPDPAAFAELEKNVQANRDADWSSRLTVQRKALAPTAGTVLLGNRDRAGDSMSSALFADSQIAWEVESDTLEGLIEREHLQNEKLFIKLDVEGAEYALLPTFQKLLSRHDIDLLISLHPYFLLCSILRDTPSQGIWTSVVRRALFVWKHIQVIRALSCRNLYNCQGQKINVFRELLKALVSGTFVTEIVATQKKWTPSFSSA